jgi:hypothetical protein
MPTASAPSGSMSRLPAPGSGRGPVKPVVASNRVRARSAARRSTPHKSGPDAAGTPRPRHRAPSSNVLGAYTGEVAERLNAPVSKTGMGVSVHRGFESPPLRCCDVSGHRSQVSREIGLILRHPDSCWPAEPDASDCARVSPSSTNRERSPCAPRRRQPGLWTNARVCCLAFSAAITKHTRSGPRLGNGAPVYFTEIGSM